MNKLEQIKEKTISDIEPIQDSSCHIMVSPEDIRNRVEEPLQETVQSLIEEKGIQPISSSANKNDLENKYGYVTIDYESLSQENKDILEKEGYFVEDFGINNDIKVVDIKIPLDENSTVEEIKEKATQLTKPLKKQKADWIPEYSVEEIMKEFFYEPQEKDSFLKAGTEDLAGYFFDNQGQKFYDSEWLSNVKKKLS